ncbi:hypothetical protein D6817_01985, partial [Candidatus Pacearchaeota archaeon]
MKILVTSTKGGAGKSTIAQQVIVPFIANQTASESVNHIEIDSYNHDADTFENSSLMRTQQLSQDDLHETLPAALFENEHLAIETGAGEIAEKTLD